MKSCLLLFVGIVVGVVLLALAQIFVGPANQAFRAAPVDSDLVILFHNKYLTQEFRSQLAQVRGGAAFQGVAVHAQPDQTLVVDGTASVSGIALTVPVRVVVHPTVDNNRVNIQVVRAELGGFAIPGGVFQSLQAPINQEINRSLASTPYRIVAVSTTSEGLLVSVVVPG